MNDLNWMDPPIEVAANSPRVDMIMTRLKQSGMSPYKAKAPVDYGNPDPLIVDMASVSRETLERMGRACVIGFERPLLLLADAGMVPELTDAIVIGGDSELDMVSSRLASRQRRAMRLREVDLRKETALELGAKVPSPDPDARPDVLYLGDGDPLFLSLQGALKARSVEVTAALSAHTALDYASTKRFSAAIVDLSPQSAHAATFLDLAASDGTLGGLPMFALIHRDAELTDDQRRAVAHASEILFHDSAVLKMAEKIDVLARRHNAATPFKPERSLSSTLCDVSSGLFSPKFLEVHLTRQMKVAETAGEPLCVMSLKVDRGGHEGIKLLSDAMRSVLRETDCAGLAPGRSIAVSLPATPYRGGVRLAARIAKAVERRPELASLGFTWRVVERRQYHTAKTLIGAATTGPVTRIAAA